MRYRTHAARTVKVPEFGSSALHAPRFYRKLSSQSSSSSLPSGGLMRLGCQNLQVNGLFPLWFLGSLKLPSAAFLTVIGAPTIDHR